MPSGLIIIALDPFHRLYSSVFKMVQIGTVGGEGLGPLASVRPSGRLLVSLATSLPHTISSLVAVQIDVQWDKPRLGASSSLSSLTEVLCDGRAKSCRTRYPAHADDGHIKLHLYSPSISIRLTLTRHKASTKHPVTTGAVCCGQEDCLLVSLVAQAVLDTWTLLSLQAQSRDLS